MAKPLSLRNNGFAMAFPPVLFPFLNGLSYPSRQGLPTDIRLDFQIL
jgi:hypothetical protein